MEPDLLPPQFIMLTPDGLARVAVKVDRVGDIDPFIRQLAADTPVVVPRAFVLGDKPVHMAVSQRNLTLFTRLDHFNITTTYATHSRGVVTPAFAAPTPGAVTLTCKWVAPANMALWFVALFDVNATPRCVYSRSSLAVACTEERHKGVFRLPLPNIYENGRLCLGRNEPATVQPDASDPMFTVFERAAGVFNRSSWNSDLLHTANAPARARTFQFSLANNESVNVDPAWPTFFDRISNTDFNNLPLTHPAFL